MFILFVILRCVNALRSLAFYVSGNVHGDPFQITRGRRDEFKYLNCDNVRTNCTMECTKYNATCIDTKECHSCRCNNGMGTFIESGCTKDEDIIPESAAKMKSFPLISKIHKLCLTVQEERNNTLEGKNCSSSLNMRWILIKTGVPGTGSLWNQLMNVGTLQCLEFRKAESTDSDGDVTINPCRHGNRGQRIRSKSGNIFSQLERKKYLYLYFYKPQRGDERYLAKSRKRNNNEKWEDNNGFQLDPVTYNGCYRFKEPNRFMLYLNNKTCRNDPCYHQFYAPILFNDKACSVVWQISSILDSTAMNWSALAENINQSLISVQNIENDEVKNLKIAQDALEEFSGSLLKLHISCKNEKKNKDERHCLLLKFESLNKYIKITTTTNAAVGSTKTTTSAVPPTTVKSPRKDTETSSINKLAIVVPVSFLVVVLMLTLVYFMCYRKRKRDSNDNQPVPTESQLYTTPSEDHKYQYIYVNDSKSIGKPNNQQSEEHQGHALYDYASNDGLLKNNQQRNEEARRDDLDSMFANDQRQDQNSSPVVEVMSEYENPSNDNQPASRESQLHTTPSEDHKYQYIYVNDSKSIGQPNNQQSEEHQGHALYDYASNDSLVKNNQQRSEEPRRDDSYEHVSANRPVENNQQGSEDGKSEHNGEVLLLYVTVTDDIQV